MQYNNGKCEAPKYQNSFSSNRIDLLNIMHEQLAPDIDSETYFKNLPNMLIRKIDPSNKLDQQKLDIKLKLDYTEKE